MLSRPNIAELLNPETIMRNVASWSWLQWVGLAMVLAAYFLPRFATLDRSADDALDHLSVIGGAFMGWSPPAATPPPPTPPAAPPPSS